MGSPHPSTGARRRRTGPMTHDAVRATPFASRYDDDGDGGGGVGVGAGVGTGVGEGVGLGVGPRERTRSTWPPVGQSTPAAGFVRITVPASAAEASWVTLPRVR
jgi:hypothetical protein